MLTYKNKYFENLARRHFIDNQREQALHHLGMKNGATLRPAGTVSEELIPKLPSETPHGPQMPAE